MLKSRHLLAVFWFILSLVIGVLNDIVAKFSAMSLPFAEVAFFRFFFGSLTLLPFIYYHGVSSLRTENILVHFIRGLLLFCSVNLWVMGLSKNPIVIATLFSFTIPLFVLILSKIFLSENVRLDRWLATIAGFVGIIIVVQPYNVNFNPDSLILVLAAAIFAFLDVINKKFVAKDSMLTMLFYSSIFTSLFAVVPTYYSWVTPDLISIFVLIFLGIGSNLILFCILKAFAISDASALAPYRYMELPISAFIGFILFNELPVKSIWYGALIIIPSSLFIVYSENLKQKS